MKDFIARSFADYRKACWGSMQLNPVQLKEIEQAYLSGMHELNRFILHSEPLREALEARLNELGCFPSDKGTNFGTDNNPRASQ